MGIKEYAIIGLIIAVIGVYFYGVHVGTKNCEDSHTTATLTLSSDAGIKLAETEPKYADIQRQVETSPLYGKSDPKCGVPAIIKFAIGKLPQPYGRSAK